MHHEPMHFIYETKILHPEFFKNKRWLEIGASNGYPSPKSHTNYCEWVGVDLEEGDHVDWVGLGHHYKDEKLFDVVAAFEVFEHDPYYDLTVTNMINHLKPNGLFIMTCAGLGRPEHGTSRSNPEASPFTQDINHWKDFYQNRIPEDFKKIPSFSNLHCGYWGINEITCDLYYRGRKKP